MKAHSKSEDTRELCKKAHFLRSKKAFGMGVNTSRMLGRIKKRLSRLAIDVAPVQVKEARFPGTRT